MSKKHAYLILAHSEPEILGILVSLLDDERNDIFIHIDKKSNIMDFLRVKTDRSNLFFLEERIDAKWGGEIFSGNRILVDENSKK